MQIKDPIIFLVGTAVGAGAAWFLAKRHYEKIAEEEISSVKESFKKLQEDAQKRADAAKNKPDLSKYVEAINKAEANEQEEKSTNTHVVNYTGFTEEQEAEDEDDYSFPSNAIAQPIEKNVDHSKPYLLNRMPYPNEEPYYSSITVMYCADGTYADTHGTEMEIEDYIGSDMMGYIEETDKDEVFIRNDELELDIDIVKDVRTYDEIMFG